MKFLNIFNRNPCMQCDFYNRVNNTCQSKKCSSAGGSGYVNIFDRIFCEAYRFGDKKREGGEK